MLGHHSRPFTEEEIRDVMFSMDKNKAPSPDGISIEFYQACREIIKYDMLVVFDYFHQHKIYLSRINYRTISLLPKDYDANIIHKYRPIFLLYISFKFFTKSLTVRSKFYVQKIIHPCQNAFIKGWYITDAVMLLQEILRETKVRKQQEWC
jgi:hypothetical protein